MNTESNEDILENLEELVVALNSDITGVLTIKPRILFQLIEKSQKSAQVMKLPIPSSKIGSITTLEASLICSLLKLSSPKCIFEFGTFLGYTTSIFALNSSMETQIYSIDLPVQTERPQIVEVDWKRVRSEDAYNDNFLTGLAFSEGEYYLRNLQSNTNLNLIKMDSLDFDAADFDLERKVDFIFIDGGHTDEIVKSDTRNSLLMKSQNSLILWHDFNSSIHGKVSEVVENYAESDLVLHVQHTLLAFTGTQFLKSILNL